MHQRVPIERKVENTRGLTVSAPKPEDLRDVHTITVHSAVVPRRGEVSSPDRTAIDRQLIDAFRAELGGEIRESRDKDSQSTDAVLETTFDTYIERIGSAMGANRPARVDFTMRLMRRSDGKEVWNARYYFQDQSFSENLLTLERTVEGSGGPGWKSAREIVEGAFRAAARDLSERRLAQFTR